MQRDLAAPAHEERLGGVGRERLDGGRERERRVEVRVHLDVAVEVGYRAVGALLALELERTAGGRRRGSARARKSCSARRGEVDARDRDVAHDALLALPRALGALADGQVHLDGDVVLPALAAVEALAVGGRVVAGERVGRGRGGRRGVVEDVPAVARGELCNERASASSCKQEGVEKEGERTHPRSR